MPLPPSYRSNLPERIARFHALIASKIPCAPDTTEARAELKAMPLGRLIHTYISYKDRFVASRRREVAFVPDFWNVAKAGEFKKEIREIESEIKLGVDLTPRLSDKVHTDGYACANVDETGSRVFHRWADKDFALNVYGVHHLHLDKAKTRELLFVEFARDQACMVMIGDHNSFDDGTLESAILRARAASGFVLKGCLPPRTPIRAVVNHGLARRGFSTTAEVDRVMVPAALMASSGHSPKSGRLADVMGGALEDIEPRLEDFDWVQRSFGDHAELLGWPRILNGTSMILTSFLAIQNRGYSSRSFADIGEGRNCSKASAQAPESRIVKRLQLSHCLLGVSCRIASKQ